MTDRNDNDYVRGILSPIWVIWCNSEVSIKDQVEMIMNRYRKFKAKPKQILVHDTPRGMQLAEGLKRKDLEVICDDLVNVSVV